VLEAGFAVLYSPVPANCKLLILGGNPGGGSESFDAHRAAQVPISHDYFAYNYPLAVKMRRLFQEAGKLKLLRESLKTNVNFFRSRSAEEWSRLPAALQRELEAFSLSRLSELVSRTRPTCILTEGFQAFDIAADAFGFGRDGQSLLLETASGQRLYAVRANNRGQRIIGMRHPTGARTSRTDEERVIHRLATDLP
jgi:hypothetical protein